MKISSKKAIAVIVGLTMVLSLVGAVSASADSLSMQQMLQLLIAAGVISPDKAAAATAALNAVSAPTTSSYSFAKDLTVGSRGADVTALQNLLGVSPATGYFGSLTKAAVIKYQLSKGISPAAGYVGAKTRAVLNASVTTTTTTTTTGTTGTTVTPTGTQLNVTLAPTSPSASAIIAGQAAADLAEFTFTNTSATPAVVTNVTLSRGGVSADTSLANVYLYNGAVRLTDGATVSSGVITFNASTGLFTVAPGQSMTIAVKSDIYTGASAGQIISVALTGVTANVPVSASLPVSGASLTVASASDIAKASLPSGGITNPVAPNATINVQAGSLNQTIWSAPLNISMRAVYLKSAAFKVIGSIPSNTLKNITLYASGVQVATAMGIDANGMITFDLTSAPYKINSSITLEVRADIVNGSSRSFSVSLQNAADLQIIDSNYNVGIAAANIPASTGNIAVSTGQVNVTTDTSLSSGNVVTGASNVPLARYTLKAYGEDMKISYLNVASNEQLDNVALYANGVQIGSTQQISATTTISGLTPSISNLKLFSLGSSLIIPAGSSVTLEVRGDVKYNGTNATTTNNTLKVAIVGYSNNTQGSFSQQLLTVPSAEADGPTMTVTGAGVALAKNASYADQSTVPNTTGVKLGSYVIQTSSAEPVRITSLTVGLGGVAGLTTNVSNLYVAPAGQPATTPINPQASNNFSVNFTIPANGSQVVDVYGDLGSLATVGETATTTLTIAGYGVNSNITISPAAQLGQTISVGAGSISSVSKQAGAGYSPDAQFVVGNTTAPIVYYNFVSQNGNSNITEMYFNVVGGITSVTVGGVTAPVVAGSSTVTGLNLSVPNTYAGTNIPVSVTYSQVGLGGTTSVQNTSVSLTGYKYISGNSTITATSSVASNVMVLVGSKPTVSVASSGDTGAGFKAIARITVSADQAGQINLQNLPLSIITTSGSTVNSLAVYVNGAAVSGVTGAFNVATGTTATGTLAFSGGYPIAAGQSVVFNVMANITGSYNAGDSVQTALGSNGLFIWQDVNGNATTTGVKIYNYPTGAASVTF
jgi:hypothetical protein